MRAKTIQRDGDTATVLVTPSWIARHSVDQGALQIVDIGMRLLTPRELARAQGFPDDYEIATGADGKRITRTDQVRLVGNSVCPPVARAIVEANR